MKYEIGRERIYNMEFEKRGYKSVVIWDVLEIENKQGVRLAIDVGEG